MADEQNRRSPDPRRQPDQGDIRGDTGSEHETTTPTDRQATPSIPWRLGGFLLLTTLVVVFAVQNTQDVELRFLGWTWTLPLVIVLLIVAVLAVLLDEILGGLVKRRRLRTQRERAELERLRKRE